MSVFALFRAEVRIIDHAKRAALQKLLLENVTTTAPGEKLDEKLAALTFIPEEHACAFLLLWNLALFTTVL